MSDKTNNENLEPVVDLEDEAIVVMTDEDGNEYYYYEEMVIPIEGKNYAILVPMDIDEDEEGCSCGCDCADDKTAVEDIDVFIARIDMDDDGEDVYVDPTDEEFEAVKKAYEEFMGEAE